MALINAGVVVGMTIKEHFISELLYIPRGYRFCNSLLQRKPRLQPHEQLHMGL